MLNTVGAGGAAVHAALARDLAPLVTGRDAERWGTTNRSYLEAHGFGLDRFIAEPLRIEAGLAIASDRPGHGVEFDWKGLETLRVS